MSSCRALVLKIGPILCERTLSEMKLKRYLMTIEAGSSWLTMSLTLVTQKRPSRTRHTLESAIAVARETETVASSSGASLRFLARVDIMSPDGKCAQLHL